MKLWGIIDIMSKKINLKQIILVVAILLLMVIFVVLLMDVFLNKMDYTSNEDINLSFVAVIVEVIFVFPYFVALIILLHGGYYALKSTPFSTAKCLHCISAGITLVSILSYELLYLGICFYDIFYDMYMSVDFRDAFFEIASLALLASIVLDIIGTILYKREQKRQLKSTDS